MKTKIENAKGIIAMEDKTISNPKTKTGKYVAVWGILLLVVVSIIYAANIRENSRSKQSSDLGMKFIYVAPGSFQMGSSGRGRDEKYAHRVTITKAYWIGKYEVTQKEYQHVMGTNPSNFKGDNRPVEMVSWYDAVKFCLKLTERERAAGRLSADCEYRLPTEAEWEFAARGGNKSRDYKYSGSDSLDSVAWYFNNSGNSKLGDADWIFHRSKDKNSWTQHFYELIKNNNCRTHEVGTKSPNELGIHDMSGNVYEWCSDWYENNSNSSAINPIGPSSGTHRVFRGGSWYYRALGCRVAERYYNLPGNSYRHMGFRILKTVTKKEVIK